MQSSHRFCLTRRAEVGIHAYEDMFFVAHMQHSRTHTYTCMNVSAKNGICTLYVNPLAPARRTISSESIDVYGGCTPPPLSREGSLGTADTMGYPKAARGLQDLWLGTGSLGSCWRLEAARVSRSSVGQSLGRPGFLRNSEGSPWNPAGCKL